MNICLLYSSFNNYDMLETEVLPSVRNSNIHIINVDDFSSKEEQDKGKKICENNNITFLTNNDKGVQSAVQTAIEWLDENEITCEWILVSQHDIFPLGDLFFENLGNILLQHDLRDVGAVGFNILNEDNSYSNNSYKNYKLYNDATGTLGIFFLSDTKSEYKRVKFKYLLIYILLVILKPIRNYFSGLKKLNTLYGQHSNSRRIFAENTFKDFEPTLKKYPNFFKVELPLWPVILINKAVWKKTVIVDKRFIFHLWFNDIAMQMLQKGYHCAVHKKIYFLNKQSLKLKYSLSHSSAMAGKSGNLNHVEKYGNHLKVFKDKWKFDYENPKKYKTSILKYYSDTLIGEYFNHDCRKGAISEVKKIKFKSKSKSK
jgi:hypothetical protein